MWTSCPPEALLIPPDQTLHGIGLLAPGAAHGPVVLEDFMLCRVIHAPPGGWCELGDDRFPLEANVAFLGRPGMRYHYTFGKGQGSVHTYLHFRFSDPEGGWPDPAAWPTHRASGPDSLLSTLLRQLFGTLELLEPRRTSLSRSLLQLILHNFITDLDVGLGEPAPPLHPSVIRAIDAILDHLQGDEPMPGAAELARSVGASADHLSRLFKQDLGVNLVEFTSRARVEHAIDLMNNSSQGLEQIGLDCGFFDAAHFTRTFRRFMGCTPSAYRRRDPRVVRSLRPLASLHLDPRLPRGGLRANSPRRRVHPVEHAGLLRYAEALQRENARPFPLSPSREPRTLAPVPLPRRQLTALGPGGEWIGSQRVPLNGLPSEPGAGIHGVPFHLAWHRGELHGVRLGASSQPGAQLAWATELPAGTSAAYLLLGAGFAPTRAESVGELRVGDHRREVVRPIFIAGHHPLASFPQDGIVLQDWWHAYPVLSRPHLQPFVLVSPGEAFRHKACLYVLEVAEPSELPTLARITIQLRGDSAAQVVILAVTAAQDSTAHPTEDRSPPSTRAREQSDRRHR